MIQKDPSWITEREGRARRGEQQENQLMGVRWRRSLNWSAALEAQGAVWEQRWWLEKAASDDGERSVQSIQCGTCDDVKEMERVEGERLCEDLSRGRCGRRWWACEKWMGMVFPIFFSWI